MKTKKKTKTRMWLVVAGMILAAVTATFAAYFQGFEFDTAGWTGATRVSSGTHGVASESGAFHAEDQNFSGLTYTDWGGYGKTFPPGGYTTTVDIYLDISPPYMNGTGYANDTRFDWSSAVNTPSCAHRRDFVFNAGFYTDGSVVPLPRFVISASNNATRSGADPRNPARDPFTIYVEGWYTFEHRFYAVPPTPGGVLRVDLTIKDAVTGAVLHTWTLSDPSDIIGTTVGGNRYGWFVINEFPFLAFDTSALIGSQDFCTAPPSTPGAKVTAGGWIEVADTKGTFGLTAKANASGAPSGNVTYQDHDIEKTVKSTAVTSVTLTQGGRCAQIVGDAKVNGTPGFTFVVDVCDYAEPGKDADTFSIFVSDFYFASGTLGGGNVQIK